MKKALRIAGNIFTVLLVIMAVSIMLFTFVSVNVFDRDDRSIFGYKAMIVLSDSMSTVDGDRSKGYFDAGDLIFVKEIDPSKLREGDIIAYRSTNTENFGETVTHKIRELTFDDEGNPAFITYGTSTGKDDRNAVTYPYVIGKYEGHIPKVGLFFNFLKTTPGYIVCIFIPFLILILMQGLNSVRLFKKYKSEQLSELNAKKEKEKAGLEEERKRLEEERLRQEEMMKQLLELQRELKAQSGSGENSES